MRGTCGKYLRKSPNQNGNRNTRRNNEDIDQPGKKKIYISYSVPQNEAYDNQILAYHHSNLLMVFWLP